MFQRTISLLREQLALRQLHLEHNVDIPSRDLTRLYELVQAKVLETYLFSAPGEEAASLGRGLSLNAKVATQLLALGSRLLGRHARVVVDVLRTAHKWQTLRELDLSGNRVGASGAAAIALYLALHPPLRLLNLSANAMDGTVSMITRPVGCEYCLSLCCSL